MTLLLAAARRLHCRLAGHAEPETTWVGGSGWAWALTCRRCGEAWKGERPVDPDTEWRREVMDAIYAEHDRKIAEPVRDLVWVMSGEWYRDIRALFPPPGYSSLNAGSWKDAADRALAETLIGIPVEVRDDAGFPALVRREDDE